MLLAAVLCIPWTLTSATESTPSPSSCPVTTPNGSTPPLELPSPFHHGNGHLWTVLYPQGRVVVSPEQVWRDGSIAVKWPWWRAERGQELTIEGRRLDAPAPPLGVEIPVQYDQFYFQATGLIFPTPGCWEVTGRAGEASLTFVVLVQVAAAKPEAIATPEAATPAATPFSCPVTLPNGTAPPGMSPSPTLHGNGKLWVTLHADGRIPVRPENVSPSGWLGVKLPWWRAVRGTLTIEARRLDAPARPARATVPDGYGDIGFQASGVLFPSPGCWEVTGRVGESSLTFVVLIELAGEADGFPATPEATP
jgi:hypothetical protein